MEVKNVTEKVTDKVKDLAEKAKGMGGVEGAATKTIEKVTSAIPSGTFLILAGGAIIGSLTLKLLGKDKTANFVGEWVPTILMLGLYNKIVKVLGSDKSEVKSGFSA